MVAPLTGQPIWSPQGLGKVNTSKRGGDSIHVFVYANPVSSKLAWSQVPKSCRVLQQFDNLGRVKLPAAQLSTLEKWEGVSLLSIGGKSAPTLDFVRQYHGINTIQEGSFPDLGPLTGKGVIIGVIDQGFDFSHPSFRSRDGSRIRIVSAWDQRDTLATKRPSQFGYGRLYDSEEDIQLKPIDEFKTETHGTHTTGIAGGSGYGAQVFDMKGIAYDADLVLVSSDLADDKVLDGVKFIMDYAKSVNKPCVINMSFGGWADAMDGTGALDQSLNHLANGGATFVASMGNEGDDKGVVISPLFPSQSLKVQLNLSRFERYPVSGNPLIDIWGQPGQELSLKALLYNANNELVSSSDWLVADARQKSGELSTGTGEADAAWTYYSYNNYPSNNKPRIYLEYTKRPGREHYVILEIKAQGRSGEVVFRAPFLPMSNAWREDANGSVLDFNLVSSKRSIRYPATAAGVISVGATYGRSKLQTVTGNEFSFPGAKPAGTITPYSSLGPNDALVIKPDVIAIGDFVSSSVSSASNMNPNNAHAKSEFNGKTYYYNQLSGTSMSAPVVTGLVALGLEANPKLSSSQIQRLLQQSAIKPDSASAELYGYGLINPRKFLELCKGFSNSESERYRCFPNPFLYEIEIIPANDEGWAAEIQVVDMLGREVSYQRAYLQKSYKVTGLSHLPRGIYHLRITDRRGVFVLRIAKAG